MQSYGANRILTLNQYSLKTVEIEIEIEKNVKYNSCR